MSGPCNCATCQRVRQLEYKKRHVEDLLDGKHGFVILSLRNDHGVPVPVRIECSDVDALEEALRILEEDIEIANEYLTTRGHRARRRRRMTVSSLFTR